jgi:hypothetical protein
MENPRSFMGKMEHAVFLFHADRDMSKIPAADFWTWRFLFHVKGSMFHFFVS